jgi:hypothetical protein
MGAANMADQTLIIYGVAGAVVMAVVLLYVGRLARRTR